MIRKIALLILLFITEHTYSQVTIYYDDDCNITMRELATHYRVSRVDTVSKKFLGEVRDYWGNDSLMTCLTYDLNGNRSGSIQTRSRNGDLRLNGLYLNGHKAGSWKVFGQKTATIDYGGKKVKLHQRVDSLETCLTKKENFSVSQFIRKSDYPEIYTLVSKSRSAYNKDATWNIIEEEPYFPKGMQALGQFIGAFIIYPEEALTNNIKGQVIVEFTITEDGSTTDFKVIKGLGYGCDEEAVRVLKLLPDWVPGYQHGKAVKTKFKLPITFG